MSIVSSCSFTPPLSLPPSWQAALSDWFSWRGLSARLATEAKRFSQVRPPRRVGWSNERIVALQIEGGLIPFWRELVRGL